jgi:ADP-ribose pyrophosphatase
MEEQAMQEYVYRGRRISLKVYEAILPNGRKAWTEAVEHPGAVVIIPLLSDRRLVTIRQYRRVIGQWLVEFPAGTLEKGEDPRECAERELKEETGYSAGKMTLLAQLYTSPGYSTEKLYFFLAEELKKGEMQPEPDELIRIEERSLGELEEMARRGELVDMKTVAGLALLRLWMQG